MNLLAAFEVVVVDASELVARVHVLCRVGSAASQMTQMIYYYCTV